MVEEALIELMWTAWIGGSTDFCSSVKRGQQILRFDVQAGGLDLIIERWYDIDGARSTGF